MQAADLLKVTEEEAQWLFGIPGHDALEDPIQVVPSLSFTNQQKHVRTHACT